MSDFKVVLKDIKNNQLHYEVFINNHWFNYFTGFAHVHHTTKLVERFRVEQKLADDDIVINVSNYSLIREHFRKTNIQFTSKFFAVVKKKDVEHCLYHDAKCGEMSFQDFCDELGYNTDSFKDFETYKACMETTQKMRGYKYLKVSKNIKNEVDK